MILTIRNTGALLLVLALGFSCNKTVTSSIPTPPVPMNGSMTATLNGASWTSTKNTAQLAIDDDNGVSGLVINGETAAEYFVFGIDLPSTSSNLATDYHDVGGIKDDIVFVYTKKTSGGGTFTQHICDDGKIQFTSVDNVNKKFSGTFSFKLHKIGSQLASDSIKITNGIFTNIGFVVTHQ